MGVYVKAPDGSMHWDESKADPNDNGGSVIDGGTGRAIAGANRQSYSAGPGGNGVPGSQSNPNGTYHAGPGAPGSMFGSGGFTSGMSGMAPTGNTTPFANYVQANLAPQAAAQAAPAAPTSDTTSPWAADSTGYAGWQARQAADAAQQAAARQVNPYINPVSGFQGAAQTLDPYNTAWNGR